MPRNRRTSPPGFVFHVLNRAAKKHRLFDTDTDYAAALEVLALAVDRFQVALFAYCIMPNHWHFVMLPYADRELSRFMHWFETTHARRWQLVRAVDGLGAVYQGRFKSIPVEADAHFLRVCRYVERNALRAHLVHRAEDWRWSSLWQRLNDGVGPVLSPWPVPTPVDWIEHVNTPQNDGELAALRDAINGRQAFGDQEWSQRIAALCGRQPSRPRGRPRKCPPKMTSDPIYT